MGGRRHLVVVVPGIGGSVLARPHDGKVVWDAGFGNIADLLLRPGRMSLDDDNHHLTPRGMITGKQLIPGWTVIDGYERLWSRLSVLPKVKTDDGKGRRVSGANVVAFGYDFRRSMVEAADRLKDEVDARLEDLGWSGDHDDPRVIVVAHSMGGLVARHWLGPGGGWRQCRALITLGTPHRGAPKALQVLVNGIRLLDMELTRPSGLLRGWDSLYELLPRYPCIWDGTTGMPRYPHEIERLGLGDRASEAFRIHEDIAKSWDGVPRSGTEMVVRLGYSHPTLASAIWDGVRLAVSKDSPSWLELGEWADDYGDGTVPAISAVPLEMDHASVIGLRVAEKHGRIGSLDRVTDLLESYEGRPPLKPARGDERPVALGVEVPELNAAGTSVSLTATLRGVESGLLEGVAVWAYTRHAGATDPPAPTRMSWDSSLGAFVGTIMVGGPGFLDLKVRAQAVPGGGDLYSEETVAVVDHSVID